MTRSLTRAAAPARWHLKDKGLQYPYWGRRLTAQEFAAHDFVLNSEVRSEFPSPVEAFEIRGEVGDELVGVVWSKHTDSLLPHARRLNRFTWHFVNWRLEIQHQYRPEWDPRVLRSWHVKDRAVEAMLEAEAEWSRDLAREVADRHEAAALADFYV